MDDRLEANRVNWNERTPIHAASEFYGLDRFKSGNITLSDIERREVGSVSGKRLLHLQCHFGMDTMSWSRLGAVATGVDFSDAAIGLACSLNDELCLGVRFICSNIYDLPNVLDEEFDVVYTAIGVLCWLPDLDEWARVVARYVRSGGMFYILDGHPFSHVLESADDSRSGDNDLYVRHPYFPNPAGEFYGPGATYTGPEELSTGAYEWQHSVGEIVNSILGAGLRIEFFNEHAVSGYRAFPDMERCDDGWWRLPSWRNECIPQLFSIKATK